jgi:hypothetical protein
MKTQSPIEVNGQKFFLRTESKSNHIIDATITQEGHNSPVAGSSFKSDTTMPHLIKWAKNTVKNNLN